MNDEWCEMVIET